MTTQARRGRVSPTRVQVIRDGEGRERSDALAVEEPLEIRAAGPGQELVRVAVTMRTPGHDFELAAGFLCTEGLVAPRGVDRVSYCEEPVAQHYNVVSVRTREPFDLGAAERNFFTTSSCGLCGKASLEAVRVRCDPLDPGAGPTIATEVLRDLPDTLRGAQDVFERTGGLHAAGLFDTAGRLLGLREDVGRHNAVDALVGARELGTVPEGGEVLLVSGRLSFEIVQKVAVAGIPILAAISAPSSLAVDTAEELGVTAVGFLRPGGFNVYTHSGRITGIG